MKVKNQQVFQAVGPMWSTWLPEGYTIKVYVSPDGVEDHFAEIGQDSEISGPNVFQCMGFNQQSFFKLEGIPENKTLNILL